MIIGLGYLRTSVTTIRDTVTVGIDPSYGPFTVLEQTVFPPCFSTRHVTVLVGPNLAPDTAGNGHK